MRRLVNEYLETHFNNICQYDFTASVQSDLDKVAENKVSQLKLLIMYTIHFTPLL